MKYPDFDFGYFGSGDEGYAQYMTAFERNFGSTGADTDSTLDDDFSDDDTGDTDDDDF